LPRSSGRTAWFLAVPSGHLWAKKRSSAWRDCKGAFVIREKGSGTREALEECLGKRPARLPHLNIAAEMGSSEAVKEAVLAGSDSVISVHAIRRD